MQRLPRTSVAALVALMTCLGPAVPMAVQAAPSGAERKLAESKALEAKVYFKRGLFREAAEAFMEAYSLSLAPDMMFNAARAYQEGKLPERALALFETYLTLDGVSGDGKADAGARIAVLKAQMAPGGPVAEDPKAPAPAPAPATVATPTPAAPTPAPAVAARPGSAPSAGASQPVASPPAKTPEAGTAAVGAATGTDKLAWGLLIGGGAVLGLAGLSYGAAIGKANEANQLPLANAEDAKRYNSRFDAAEGSRTAAVALAVAGAGLATWGAWRLWIRGPSQPGASPGSVTWVAPQFSGDGLGGSIFGGIACGGPF